MAAFSSLSPELVQVQQADHAESLEVVVDADGRHLDVPLVKPAERNARRNGPHTGCLADDNKGEQWGCDDEDADYVVSGAAAGTV